MLKTSGSSVAAVKEQFLLGGYRPVDAPDLVRFFLMVKYQGGKRETLLGG